MLLKSGNKGPKGYCTSFCSTYCNTYLSRCLSPFSFCRCNIFNFFSTFFVFLCLCLFHSFFCSWRIFLQLCIHSYVIACHRANSHSSSNLNLQITHDRFVCQFIKFQITPTFQKFLLKLSVPMSLQPV
jgi:hypothetical protein